MDPIKKFLSQVPHIEEKLGYHFKNQELLLLAFIHRSFVNEYSSLVKEHNERLEFLGDAILGFLISSYLYQNQNNLSEGDLSHLRARIVEGAACMRYIETLEVHSYLLLGKGEKRNPGRGRNSILADLFEAIIGAIYLDGGIEAAKTFLFSHFTEEIKKMVQSPPKNMKAEIQDFVQKNYQTTPYYKILEELGPDHEKTFKVAIYIEEKEIAIGEGQSKKQAEIMAAKKAWELLANHGR